MQSNIKTMETYKATVELKHNKSLYEVDEETGEMDKLNTKPRPNNLNGRSKLDYNDFGMINLQMLPTLKKHLTHTEISIVMTMIMRAEYETNSLAPLNSDMSDREIGKVFDISPTIVGKTFEKLFDLGVYAKMEIASTKGRLFWILNPYIFWKGKWKKDSLFEHFYNVPISGYMRENVNTK